MEMAEFERMVARLEKESEQSPRAYRFKVGLLALAGFALLALLLAMAGAGLLLLAGIVVATVVSGGAFLLLLLKLGKLLIFLAVPLWFLVKSSLQALFVRLPPPQGREVLRDEAPALFAAIDHMRRKMRGPRFHKVLLVDDMNAAVVQRPLFGLVGFPRNYLILGLPLLEALSPREALAVVAHEYGHLAGQHNRFGAFIYRLRNTWGTIQAIADRWSGWTGRLLRKPVQWYAPYFNAYTFVLARADEYQADAASGLLAGRGAAISALKRVNVAGGTYRQFLEQTYEGARTSYAPPGDLVERWAALAAQPHAADLAQKFLADALQREPSVADTHPSLKQRLAALGADGDALHQLPTPLQEPSAAQTWLGEAAPVIRREFQQLWAEQVQDGWREQYAQWEERRKRHAELQARSELTADEELELLHLTVKLNPDDDHRVATAAFNAKHPDNPSGLYLEGVVLLGRDDETGLDRLERAMALDGDAIRPACERAYEFLIQRGDARADSYAERWRERAAWENLRAEQINQLDPKGGVAPAELSPQQLAQVQTLLRAASPAIQKAWVARRVIPADPAALCYVVVVRLSAWARWRNKQPQVLDALSQQEGWPGHVFFCTGDAPYQALCKRVKQVPGSGVLG